jgi:GT2 family glycosyltransferase
MKIGVNLLVRNMADNPLHRKAMGFAMSSLLGSDIKQHDFRCMILDNASTCPETIEFLSKGYSPSGRIRVIRSAENLGIARGRNAVYRRLDEDFDYLDFSRWHPDYVIEMHTDHVFPAVWLAPIIEYMESHPDVGIMGPALLSPNVHWCVEPFAVNYEKPESTFKFVNEAAERNRLPGRVLPGLTHPAVKRWKMLEQIGFYDEAMPGLTNFEDTEEAYRAHKAGWKILINFGSVVYHHYHFSRCDPGVTNHLQDYELNGRYCQAKHGPEFDEFCEELGRWMDRAYGKVEV